MQDGERDRKGARPDEDYHEKVEFIWDDPAAVVAVPERLEFRPVIGAATVAVLEAAVAEAVGHSLDRADRLAVQRLSRKAAALRLLEPDGSFVFDQAWWHVAVTAGGELVGFVQPVLFRDGGRDGLEEGTIHAVGVVPAFRGQGYGLDLLAQGTATLHRIGVWRVYADTDVENVPMIRTFERAGYRRGDVRTVPIRLGTRAA